MASETSSAEAASESEKMISSTDPDEALTEFAERRHQIEEERRIDPDYKKEVKRRRKRRAQSHEEVEELPATSTPPNSVVQVKKKNVPIKLRVKALENKDKPRDYPSADIMANLTRKLPPDPFMRGIEVDSFSFDENKKLFTATVFLQGNTIAHNLELTEGIILANATLFSFYSTRYTRIRKELAIAAFKEAVITKALKLTEESHTSRYFEIWSSICQCHYFLGRAVRAHARSKFLQDTIVDVEVPDIAVGSVAKKFKVQRYPAQESIFWATFEQSDQVLVLPALCCMTEEEKGIQAKNR